MKQVSCWKTGSGYLHGNKIPSNLSKHIFMKRILFVCAGQSFPKGAFAFLQSLQQQEPICVTGLFFRPIDDMAMATVSQVPIPGPYLRLLEKEKKVVDDHKALFAGLCEQHHIKHQIHENEEEWYREILDRESRFSDMMVVSAELFYSDMDGDQPNSFLQEALHVAECPVMIVPEEYTPFQHVVVAYDGGRESLFALKQFCYLLPQYTSLPTEFIYAKDDDASSIPDIDNLKNYSRLHFSCMNFSKLQFKAANYFATWIGEKQQVLMVCGSFGRSSLSYVTRHSFAKEMIRGHKMPIFIAHM
jgi:hypothetical protein